MEEPFGLRAAEIAELTDAQIMGLYGRERDSKTGAPLPVGVETKRKFTTPEEARANFINVTMAFGKSYEQAVEMWDRKRGA